MLSIDEGKRNSMYLCTEGYWTIGIGHMISKDKGTAQSWLMKSYGRLTLTDDEVHKLFIKDCITAESQSKQIALLDEYRQKALTNMIFQLGYNGVLKFKKMVAALKVKDYQTAYKEALDSRWSKQTPNRAKRVAEVLRDGEIAYARNYK